MRFLTFTTLCATTVLASALPYRAAPRHQHRKECIVLSHGDVNVSDTPAILQAFEECGRGGRIVFEQNKTYSLGELTILEGCVQCEVVVDGTIRLSDNIELWNKTDATLAFDFQSSITAFVIRGFSGAYIHSPSRTGVIDGAGQKWWDAFAGQEALDENSLRRPILLTIWESDHVKLEGIWMKNSPMWNNFITDSSYITYTDMRVSVQSENENEPKNSDGWDTYRSDHVLIEKSHVVVGDDCFSFKPNSTFITVRDLYCEGTHGVSVGSLAQYKGVYDIVQDAWVSNITFVGGSNAVRIKTWAGDVGSALVQNVHYDDITVQNVTEALTIDACYFNLDAEECAAYPTKVDIVNVTVSNVRGTVAKDNVADLVCAEDATCDISFSAIDLNPISGKEPVYSCQGVTTEVGVPCTAAESSA